MELQDSEQRIDTVIKTTIQIMITGD